MQNEKQLTSMPKAAKTETVLKPELTEDCKSSKNWIKKVKFYLMKIYCLYMEYKYSIWIACLFMQCESIERFARWSKAGTYTLRQILYFFFNLNFLGG